MLDLASTTIVRASDGSVEVHMRIPGLPSSLTGVIPSTATGVDDSGTPLQIARYVTRWDYQGDAYYVMNGHADTPIGVLQNLPITVDSTLTFDTAFQAVGEKTTDGTSFRKVAAVSGGSLAILGLFLALWLQFRRRTHS